MITLALAWLPLVAGVLLWLPGLRARATALLVAVSSAVTALSLFEVVRASGEVTLMGFVRVDATSQLMLAVVDPIFLGVSVHVWSRVASTPSLRDDGARFAPLALIFLAAANAVLIANHLVVLWVALEASTLAAAPLIVRRGSAASRRASWHYLLFSSVGLGLVLLGFSCFARAAEVAGAAPEFFVDAPPAGLTGVASLWRALGVALAILGVGTKLGLAPMYSWLPEAYEQAPAPVTALLGAVQFNCALVVLLRVVQLYRPDHGALITAELLVMGIASMLVSTVSIIATRSLRRLLAYASINHAGVIAIGLGVGKGAAYAVMLYSVSNAFIKAILFLTAGHIEAHHRTRDTTKLSGLINELPYSGLFLMVGTFALLGFPPFGSFYGELLILSALVSSDHMMVFAAFCALITGTFVATGRVIFPMIWGEAHGRVRSTRQTFASASPKVVFLVMLVALGVYIPPVINGLLLRVAASLEAP